jgi:hypothetical protein
LRRQDAGANGEAGPKGTPQERRVKRMRVVPLPFNHFASTTLVVSLGSRALRPLRILA